MVGGVDECLIPCRDILEVVSKDIIPAIDNPKFLKVEEFESSKSTIWLESLTVLGVSHHDQARAYPTNILNWHEIVNDNFNGQPLSVTYCPLTASGISYHTDEIAGSTLGTTGHLYKNNLVFYDRVSDSYYSQMLSRSLKGEHIGNFLPNGVVDQVPWLTWKALYPDTTILSEDTGYERNYAINPYEGYDHTKDIYYPSSFNKTGLLDGLYHPKVMTQILFIDESVFLIPLIEFWKNPIINHVLGNKSIVLFFDIEKNILVPYSSILNDGTILSFSQKSSKGYTSYQTMNSRVFVDSEGSTWDINGKAISGTRKDSHLTRIPGYQAYWFSAVTFFPKSELILEVTNLSAPVNDFPSVISIVLYIILFQLIIQIFKSSLKIKDRYFPLDVPVSYLPQKSETKGFFRGEKSPAFLFFFLDGFSHRD
ncbi:MAG: DUF3179 domain-containing protein [Candidatus Hodarchaeales archaeon]|jgi:hypothetical protein